MLAPLWVLVFDMGTGDSVVGSCSRGTRQSLRRRAAVIGFHPGSWEG